MKPRLRPSPLTAHPSPRPETPFVTTLPAYTALALQADCHAINQASTVDEARTMILAAIARMRKLVLGSKGFIGSFKGSEVKLVVLPEYVLTGFPLGETIPAWAEKAALEPGGPEYEALAKLAQDGRLYLAGNAYERDAHFPGLYFQCCFLIAPNGETVLRYRRLISLFAPTPYDVWDKYLDLYGLEGVFPVAKTELGTLAAIASEEILYPEIARCLAMRGAEVFLHSSSETGSPQLTVKDIAKRARAIENLAYVVSANTSAITGTPIPAHATNGLSKIVDFNGLVLAEAADGESMVANATIDLAALRRARSAAGMANLLVRQPFALFAQSYAAHQHHAPNSFLKSGQVEIPDRAFFQERQRREIERLRTTGVIGEPL
jgi:predicted amidohydrolase